MAISWVESQIFEKSFARRGVRDRRVGKVVRRGMLQGLDDTVASYNAALDYAQTHWASFDPIEGLPRQSITIEKISGDKAIVQAVYSLSSNLNIDNSHAMERANADTKTENIIWYSKHKTYKASNYPELVFDLGVSKRTPHPVTVIMFQPHMTYGSTPITASIRAMHNRINKSTFSLGGINWPQHTVLFIGLKLNVSRLGFYTLYDTTWFFAVREDQWRQEGLGIGPTQFAESGATAGQTQIESALMYDTASFSIPTNWTP